MESITHYHLGLDFGQLQDYTALTIIERYEERFQKPEFRVRHLQRWPLGTPYHEIVDDLKAMLARSPLNDPDPALFKLLALDATGVGLPVCEQVRRADLGIPQKNILITGGGTVNTSGWLTHVPKRDLVSAVSVALQTGRLKIAPELKDAKTLRTELENFKVKITLAANDTYGVWREGQHDDLVLAVALALWSMRHLLHHSYWPKTEGEKLGEMLPEHLRSENIEKLPPEHQERVWMAQQYQLGKLRREMQAGRRPGDFDYDPFSESRGDEWPRSSPQDNEWE
ncbi:MAG TPA: hypothetical protein VFD58_32070 [Blastocatellia bacterium]|nr:hypothetical protein [Blastocatellia bacterium]